MTTVTLIIIVLLSVLILLAIYSVYLLSNKSKNFRRRFCRGAKRASPIQAARNREAAD